MPQGHNEYQTALDLTPEQLRHYERSMTFIHNKGFCTCVVQKSCLSHTLGKAVVTVYRAGKGRRRFNQNTIVASDVVLAMRCAALLVGKLVYHETTHKTCVVEFTMEVPQCT